MEIKLIVALLLLTFIACVYSQDCYSQSFENKHVSRATPSKEAAKKKAKSANKSRSTPSSVHDVFFLIGGNVEYRMNQGDCEMQQPCAVQWRCNYEVMRGVGSWNCKPHRAKWCPHYLPGGHYDWRLN